MYLSLKQHEKGWAALADPTAFAHQIEGQSYPDNFSSFATSKSCKSNILALANEVESQDPFDLWEKFQRTVRICFILAATALPLPVTFSDIDVWHLPFAQTTDHLSTAERKTCTGCSTTLALTEFYSKGSRLDSSCKACIKKEKAKRNQEKRHRALDEQLNLKRTSQRRLSQNVLDVPSLDIVEVMVYTDNFDLTETVRQAVEWISWQKT